MEKREEPWGTLSNRLKELAAMIGLKTGYIRITVTEGRAAKIEALQYARVCCVRRKTNQWEMPQGCSELDMAVAPKFVTKYLERLMVSILGQYGYVEAHLSGGEVEGTLIYSGQLPPGPERLRSPTARTQGEMAPSLVEHGPRPADGNR